MLCFHTPVYAAQAQTAVQQMERAHEAALIGARDGGVGVCKRPASAEAGGAPKRRACGALDAPNVPHPRAKAQVAPTTATATARGRPKAKAKAKARGRPKAKPKAAPKQKAKAKAAPTPKGKAKAKAMAKPLATPRAGSLKVPPAPFGSPDAPDPSCLWGGGKVHVSHRLQAYRVFLKADDRVDKQVRWCNFSDGHTGAFREACRMIRGANSK